MDYLVSQGRVLADIDPVPDNDDRIRLGNELEELELALPDGVGHRLPPKALVGRDALG
jgi:hypothetical protein